MLTTRNLYDSSLLRFLPEPALSVNTKIPRFARNDRSEGVEMSNNDWKVKGSSLLLTHVILPTKDKRVR